MKNLLFQLKKRLKRTYRGTQPHYKTANKFYIQELECRSIKDRMDLFRPACEGKDVIHFGCTDWPIFNPEYNLHIQLAQLTKSLDGFDLDQPGIAELRKYVDQDYYWDYDQLPTKQYDVCLVPETIEHVENVAEFISQLAQINAQDFYITGPNCFSPARKENFKLSGNTFTEVVHPDHNAWYSPYTLKNRIEKNGEFEVQMVYIVDGGRSVCCHAKRIKK